MTELLYLHDSYLKEFSAKITGINGETVSLDKTAFFPAGGGQPSDTGKIFFSEKEFSVISVKKENEEVWHTLNSVQGLAAGSKITAKIDFRQRYNLMRMHTSAHVLAAVIFGETGKLITGNQIGWPKSRMDFDAPQSFDSSAALQIEKKVNQAISKNNEVSVFFLPRETALKKPELVRLKGIMPPSLKEWRVVQIGSVDLQADGGTHVKNTKEIGQVKIAKTENKGAQNKRIYWELTSGVVDI